MELSLTMIIMEIPLFDAFTTDEQEIIEPYLICRKVPLGSVIYKQGEHGNSVCFVVDGELDVIKHSKEGKGVKVARLRSGQSVGEMSLIDGYTRSASVRAHTNASVLILKRDNFNELLEKHSQIGIKMLKGLAKMLSTNLRKSSDKLARLMISS